MKKSVSLFVASIFAINSFAFADGYPCQDVYEAKLEELHADYVVTAKRTLETKKRSVGGAKYMSNGVKFYEEENGTQADAIKEGTAAAGPMTVLAGTFPGMGAAGSTKAILGLMGLSSGVVVGLLAALPFVYITVFDVNLDFKEITHPKSTLNFFRYIQIQAAQDAILESFSGKESVRQKQQERLNLFISMDERAKAEIQEANKELPSVEEYIRNLEAETLEATKLIAINKKREKRGLAGLSLRGAFPDFDDNHYDLAELAADYRNIDQKRKEDVIKKYSVPEESATSIDLLYARYDQEEYKREDIPQLIKNMIEADPDLFCLDGEPMKLREMNHTIKKKLRKLTKDKS